MLAVTLLPAACKTHRHHPARLAEAADSELFVPQTGGSRRALLSADGSSYDHRTRCSTPSSAAQTRQWPLPAPSKASAHLWSRRLNAFVTSIVCASWRALGNDPKRTLLLNRYAALPTINSLQNCVAGAIFYGARRESKGHLAAMLAADVVGYGRAKKRENLRC